MENVFGKFVGSAIVGIALSFSALAVDMSGDWQIVVPDQRVGQPGREIRTILRYVGQKLSAILNEGMGWNIPCVHLSKRDKGRHAIFIGADCARAGDLRLDGLAYMDNVIAEKDGDIYLWGDDRPGGKPNPSWVRNYLPSVKAVTAFLEEFASVRFLMPGDVGTDIPRIKKLAVPDGFFRKESPRTNMAAAWQVFHQGMPTLLYASANNICGTGSYQLYGGHTYGEAFPVKKYGKTHPEYYALRAGKRQLKTFDPALCISNPEVADLLVKFLVSTLDETGLDVIELGQNDGNGFCECERCSEYGKGLGFSEQFWRFHRDVAERVYRERPDKKVMITSYGPTCTLPKTFKEFPPNVMIELMKYSHDQFDAWGKYKVPGGFAAYVYEWGWYRTPGFTPKWSATGSADLARRFAAHDVKGIWYCADCTCSGLAGPASYVFQRLLEHPEDDTNRLFDEFCTRFYGDAVKPMRSFHQLLDERLEMFVAMCERSARVPSRPRNPVDLFVALYPPDVLARLEFYLTSGEKLAGGEKQKSRFALVRREFDYMKNLALTCHRYNAYRIEPTKETFAPVAKLVEERNRMIESFYDEKGVMKGVDGWPEIAFFSRSPKSRIQTNGKLAAMLAAPFTWDVAHMRKSGFLPGAESKSLQVCRTVQRPTAEGLARGSVYSGAIQKLGGVQLERISQETTFKALYDDVNIYLLVSGQLNGSVRVAPTGHDGRTQAFECLELFVDPFGQREKFYHFAWNPVANSYYDAACGFIADPLDPLYGKPDPKWDGEWQYEVVCCGGMWHSVATVPFATLGVATPKSGDVWNLNVGRESYLPGDKLELALWNPNLESQAFAAAEAFGRALFE